MEERGSRESKSTKAWRKLEEGAHKSRESTRTKTSHMSVEVEHMSHESKTKTGHKLVAEERKSRGSKSHVSGVEVEVEAHRRASWVRRRESP